MEAVEQQLHLVRQELSEMKNLLEVKFGAWPERKKRLYGSDEQLRKEKELLMKEKELLMKKEEQLQEEKLILLKQQTIPLEPLAAQQQLMEVALKLKLATHAANILKRKRSADQLKLVESLGANFVFSDRERSFEVLSDCLAGRFKAWQNKVQDRNLHPIPFLADGPGSGKSRFLQELPESFRSYVISSSAHSPEFQNALRSALYINVTFGNGTRYLESEVSGGIEKALCLRILYNFSHQEFQTFGSFLDSSKNDSFSLSSVIELFGDDIPCVVLGIDEVNLVHEINPRGLYSLFALVGALSCNSSAFFVPILAGTVIGPMKEFVTKSTHPPLHIPLPLLSLKSSLNIIAQKDAKYAALIATEPKLCMLISDIGGHCRALEILFDGLERGNRLLVSYWDDALKYVTFTLTQRYAISQIPLGSAIAASLLRLKVEEQDHYLGTSLKYLDLEEKGLVKLENGLVQIPLVFVHSFLGISQSAAFSRFWSHLLIAEDFWWQDWEVFNRTYIAFRLSLFGFLGHTSISLSKFFQGARMNLPVDIFIKIPPISSLELSTISYRYPTTNAPEFRIGDSVLNGDGAAFDSFIFLETTSNTKILLALQMKLSNRTSARPQEISQQKVNDEFQKINDSVAKHLPGVDFVCVLLGRCEGTFLASQLPSKCVAVTLTEHDSFYGSAIAQRLQVATNVV